MKDAKRLVHEKGKGRLIIVSSPSGGGKTTVVERWLAERPELTRSVSYTTRSPRVGEKNGVDYFFIRRADFLKKRRQGFFLEWANVFGQFYGTSKAACFDCMERGCDVVLTIDIQGMRKIRRQFARRVSIATVFIRPPSMKALRERLKKRRTDSAAEIEKRLWIANEEMKASIEYDYRIVNRKVEDAVQRIDRLLFGSPRNRETTVSLKRR